MEISANEDKEIIKIDKRIWFRNERTWIYLEIKKVYSLS